MHFQARSRHLFYRPKWQVLTLSFNLFFRFPKSQSTILLLWRVIFYGYAENWNILMDCVGCRELIERIIVLGFYYREMERFSAKCRNLSWIRSANTNPLEKKEKGSVYRRALANGIVEVLSVYRSAVLHIEQKLLSETMPILATVTQGLNKVIFSVFSFQFI